MLTHQIKNILSSVNFSQGEWCTVNDLRSAVSAIESEFLDDRKFFRFLSANTLERLKYPKVGVVCAGNIPLVGFGDMFYALLAGAEVWLKPSRRDPLMRRFEPLVHLVDNVEQLRGTDALMVMGSDETCAALRSMFPKKPMLLRSSRHSVAVLRGDETPCDIALLADDIFLYSGRGCRSVSHIYLPRDFDLSRLAFPPREMTPAWRDAYRYAKAISAMCGDQFVDGGYYLLKQGHSSHTTVIGYSFYDEQPILDMREIQCIVGHGNIPFGSAQRPTLYDFADGVSPIEFLCQP